MRDEARPSQHVERQRKHLRADYALETGTPFEHFFCPIMCKDEATELCMGHIVNQAFPDSSRKRIVQRKDVDGFYGLVVEADFTTLVQARGTDLRGVLFDPSLRKKMRPRFVVDGEEFKHYHDKGQRSSSHSLLILENAAGEPLRLVLQKSPEEVVAAQDKKWEIVIEDDYRIPAIASLIKAAYLTLFRLLGYRYALSAAGLSVGYQILGEFYRQNRDKTPQEAKQAAVVYFRAFVAMLRPVNLMSGTPPAGTIDDHQALVCFGSSGRPFGLVVYVRTSKQLHAVLMPAFTHPDSVEVYLSFLKNDNETVRVRDCVYDPVKKHWLVSTATAEIVWPKNSDTFDIADP